MSKGLLLRDLVMERLVVAADEIFALFERTIAEYEEEALRSKLSLETHNKGVQTLSVNLTVVPSPDHIKEEQTPSTKQEEPPLEFPMTSVSVKTEDYVEKSFLLQQEPFEVNREEPGCSLYLESDKDKQTYSCSDTDDSDDWEPSAKRSTTCDGQESETVHRKDSERGFQSHLESQEIRHHLLQRPTDIAPGEQLREETPGSSTAHCSSEDWDPGSFKEWMDISAKEHKSSNLRNSLMGINTIHSEANLQKHMLIQIEQMPFSCSVCKRGFTKMIYLKRHMTTHSTEKSSSCPECGLKLKHPRNLYRHISAVHRGARPYSCSICEKAFAQKSDFIKHTRTHTGEKPYSCSICEKAFAQKIYFICHMRTHTGEKPFSCTVCYKSFVAKGILQKHMRIHRNHAVVQNTEKD